MKIRIGLFFGGRTVEHEVSVISALQAFRRFDREKYEVLPIYITRDSEFYTGEAASRIEEYRDIPALLQKCTRVQLTQENGRVRLTAPGRFRFGRRTLGELDVAFPVVHGANVEDGALQGFFRTLGLPFAGCDVGASAAGMDKYLQKLAYRAAGLPVVEAIPLHVAEDREAMPRRILDALGLPVVVKPRDLGSSVGIRLVRSEAELPAALDEAFGFSPSLLAERAVTHLRELNCAVLGDHESARASECEEPVMHDDILSYADKYLGGGGKAAAPKTGSAKSGGMSSLQRLLPAPIDPALRTQVQQYAVAAFRALGCSGTARIDFLMDGESGEIFVNEINTCPGSLSFYLWEASGLPYPQLLDAMVSLALKRERERAEYQSEIETGILAGFTGAGAKGAKGAKG